MYSKSKPYQRTKYTAETAMSYDRYLKEAENQGRAENVKESELEKPYNLKKSATYSSMQQNYDGPLPPTVDPGTGTGGLKCYWVSTGCEQLVGCWAGSDIKLDGPEAATAGYIPVEVIAGAIVKQEIGGSESRGVTITLDPSVRQNIINVGFKDGLGAIHTESIDITCSQVNTWAGYDTALPAESDRKGLCISSDQTLHITYRAMTGGTYTGLTHATWNGLTYSAETIDENATGSTCVIDGSDHIHVVSQTVTVEYIDEETTLVHYNLRYYTNATGSWVGTTVLSQDTGYYTDLSINLDSSNYVHIIANIYEQLIVHVTNATGSWVSETVTSVTGTRAIEGLASVISGDDTIYLTYIAYDYYPLTGISYLNYISKASGGSWSAITTIDTSTSFDRPDFVITQDTTKRIITSKGSTIATEYYYSGSWQSRTIYATDLRYPTVTTKGNQIFVGVGQLSALTYYPKECIYDTSWSLPDAIWLDVSGSFGPRQTTIKYDSYRNALHFVWQNGSNNLGHAIRYL